MDNGDARVLRLLNVFEFTNFSVDHEIAGVGAFWIDTGENVHQCGFARAVFADQCVDLAAPDLQVDVVQRSYAREFLGDVSHFENIVLHLPGSFIAKLK